MRPLIKQCKHCEDEFDANSARKRRVGGYVMNVQIVSFNLELKRQFDIEVSQQEMAKWHQYKS